MDFEVSALIYDYCLAKDASANCDFVVFILFYFGKQ